MTVKFSSLHIKRKSPLTFPQTEQAEHWHREGMKKRTKAELHCREIPHISDNAQAHRQVMNGAQRSNTKSLLTFVEGQQICPAKTSER